MVTAACVGSITGDLQRVFERTAMARHAGAAHHDGAGAVLVAQRAADLDHFRQRAFARGRFRNAHVQRPLAGEAVGQSHLPEIAHVTPDRSLGDRDDAEVLGARKRGQHAALGNAEHGAVGTFTADLQSGIAVAGDDEGGRAVVALDQPAQRHRDAVDVGLALDAEGTLGQRLADQFRPALEVERLQRILQPLRDLVVGVRIDDENARPGHDGLPAEWRSLVSGISWSAS
ncbi:hypothetical protein ACVMFA_009895 [Bradyrhizobium liaoningense]